MHQSRVLRAARWWSSFAIAGVPAVAGAHVLGTHQGADFGAGFAHPFSGFDHQLAMLAIGLWASQQRGRTALAMPLGFVAGAAVGLGVGALALVAPAAPAVLAATVAALGACVALARRSPVPIALVAALGCGLLHGHAHAQDLATSFAPARFAAGFLCATALLHAGGFSVAVGAPNARRVAWTRAGGGAIALAGVVLLAATLG